MGIEKVAMIGAGSMGGGLALLMGEHGFSVGIQDPSSKTVDELIQSAEKQGIHGKLSKYTDYASLCASLSTPKVIFFSLPHGSVGDTVVEGLKPYLDKGDIIIDCSNEMWENTQRRQGKLVAQGLYYIGCGVSGGYQAARQGPSMCPAGEDEALNVVLKPLLEKISAKDKDGKPCVAKIGEGGAGHYVKMVHNGIEHAMMSAISEAWTIMNKQMRLSYDEISKIFSNWNSHGELEDTFLIQIGADICSKKDESGHHVLADVKDKVVQDVDNTEGTGIWSNTEAESLHVAAPTLTVAHYLRVASAYRGARKHVKKTFHGSFLASKIEFKLDKEKEAFIEDLRQAVYTTCLVSFVQGMSIIDSADKANKWAISFPNIVQIWKAGCIIQSEHISSLLAEVFDKHIDSASSSSKLTSSTEDRTHSHNLLYSPPVVRELKAGFPALRRIVAKSVETNAIIPSMSATLDYLKYVGNLDLPTQFTESELDYFGKHMYDSKSEDKGPGKPETGKRHFEWKPASKL